MVEVKRICGGRYEVHAPDVHHEVFEGLLGAQLASMAIAVEIASETGQAVEVRGPWGTRTVGGPVAAAG